MKIDTAIYPSFIQYVYWVSFFGVIVLVGLSLSFVWWQFVVLAILGAVVVAGIATKPVLKHLIIDHQHSQLLIRAGQKDELWQGVLNTAMCRQGYIQLQFAIDEPYVGVFNCCVFYDQMTADEWRKLNAMGRYL